MSGETSEMQHFNQIDLARRWKMSPRTLERWRWLRQGPVYIKLGGKVLYRPTDVEQYEADHLQLPGLDTSKFKPVTGKPSSKLARHK